MTEREQTAGGDMVPVMRSDDPVRVRQVVELLADEGIPCATPGLEHRSMLGFAGPYVDIVVLVGEADAKRALGILKALESGVLVEEEDPEPPEPDPKATYRRAARKRAKDDEPLNVDARLRRIAAFAAFVLPGGAHVYTRKYAHAVVVVVLYLVAVFAGPANMPLRFLAVLAVLGIDIAGGIYWADVSQGRAAGSMRRHTVMFGALCVPGLMVGLAGPGAELLAGPHGRAYCHELAACGDADRDDCMRREAALAGTEARVTEHCVECVEEAECELGPCASECGW